jgi:hypothetical protein
MTTEYIVVDPIVACLTIKAPVAPATSPGAEPWFRKLSQLLRAVCLPNERSTIFFDGRAYCPVYANNLDAEKSCSWTGTEDGGGYGQAILAWVDRPKMWVRVDVKLVVAKDGRWAWLTVGHNPTSLTVGNNVHPAAFLDPHTGVADLWPSSSWAAMTRAFRLGFEFLEALSAPEVLFDAATQLAIARGHFHLVSVQYAAAKAVTNVTDFLQGGTVIYGQTIARGRGIINNAKHLGLRFKPYVDEDSPDNRVSGFMLQKLHGEKLHVSVSFYDKLVSLQEKHQETTLSLAEAQTVNQSVREDITAHSSFILRIVVAAREKLANMDAADRQFFALISPEEFLQGTPQSTAWWLQRAIYVLSHWRRQGRWVRYSFGTWLVPFVEKEVLHLDVVAGLTTRGYYALLALSDPVAIAWRSDPTPGASNWAGRLARIAGCTRSTVYNRREEWWQLYGIDIAYPLQMYSDILYFGHNSIAPPASITALLVAVDQREGVEAVRLHAEALAAFERKRVEIVNPALVSRPRAMELRLPFVAPPDLDDFDNLPPDFDQLGLDEVVPARPGSAKTNLAPAAAKSGARVLRPYRLPALKEERPARSGTFQMRVFSSQGLTKASGKKVSRIRRKPPPPRQTKRIVLPVRRNPPPPPTEPKRIILRVPRKPSPRPPATRRIILRVWDDPRVRAAAQGIRDRPYRSRRKGIVLPARRNPSRRRFRSRPLLDADNLRILVARPTRTPRC